ADQTPHAGHLSRVEHFSRGGSPLRENTHVKEKAPRRPSGLSPMARRVRSVHFSASLVSPPPVHDKAGMTMTIKKLLAAVVRATSTLVAAPTLGHSRGWHGYHAGGHGGYDPGHP